MKKKIKLDDQASDNLDEQSRDGLTRLSEIYKELADGYDVSRNFIRAAKDAGEYDKVEGLGYGEIDLQSFADFIASLSLDQEHSSFADLGSGTGKACLVAMLSGRFASVLGVEILESLHDVACQAHTRLLESTVPDTRTDLVRADIFQVHEQWECCDVLFITWTLFSQEMRDKLTKLLDERVRKGAIVVTSTMELGGSSRAKKQSQTRIKYAKGSLQFVVHRFS